MQILPLFANASNTQTCTARLCTLFLPSCKEAVRACPWGSRKPRAYHTYNHHRNHLARLYLFMNAIQTKKVKQRISSRNRFLKKLMVMSETIQFYFKEALRQEASYTGVQSL